jgi:hypothetical protein
VQGASIAALARAYGRTRKAVVARLQRFGIIGYDPLKTEED